MNLVNSRCLSCTHILCYVLCTFISYNSDYIHAEIDIINCKARLGMGTMSIWGFHKTQHWESYLTPCTCTSNQFWKLKISHIISSDIHADYIHAEIDIINCKARLGMGTMSIWGFHKTQYWESYLTPCTCTSNQFWKLKISHIISSDRACKNYEKNTLLDKWWPRYGNLNYANLSISTFSLSFCVCVACTYMY